MRNIHGGNIYQESLDGKEWLDFSANINLLGMPDAVYRAAVYGVKLSEQYPDVEKQELTKQFAHRFSLPEEMILWGNGAAELFYAFCFAVRPKKALLAVPAFLEYERALSSVGCQIEELYLQREERFQFTEKLQRKLLEKIRETEVLILCNPNNPTGWLLSQEFLLECRKECERWVTKQLQ